MLNIVLDLALEKLYNIYIKKGNTMNNNDLAVLIWLVLSNVGTYFLCKYHFIRHTIDVLEDKGLLVLEDDEK
jgi:hypothetical protein